MAIENISVDIKSNIEKLKRDLTDIDNRIKQLKNNRPKLQIDADNLQKTKSSISAIDVAIKKLQAQKAEVKVSTESADIAKKKMQEISHAIDLLRARKATLNLDVQMLKGADTRLTKLDREMQTLNTRKANLQVSAEQLMGSSSRASSLAEKLRKLSSTDYRINVKDNLSSLGNKASNAGSKILSVFNPLTSKINQALGVGLAVKGVDSAVNLVTGSIDGAIKRMDTLNNYPKVMANLGVSTQDAVASQKELVKGLQGLPTSLDAGVQSVQRFTSKNEDIKKSTRMFLALNNAVLAGGASADIQSSAIEQISQSYSKGKPDIIEFRSLLTAAPAQVKQVATAMGKSTSELQEAMTGKNATVSMDDFMNKVVELNEKGGGGLASFADQAKSATGGVQTGLANMHTAVTRGVAGVMGSIDKALKAGGQGGIATVLGKVGDAFEKNLSKIGSLIETHQKDISKFFTSVTNAVSKFDFISFFKGVGSGLQSMGRDAKFGFNIARPLLSLLGNGSVLNGIGKLIPRLFELGIAFKAVGLGLKIASGVSGIFGKLTKLKLPSFGKKGGGLGSSPKEIGTNLLGDLGGIAKNAGNLALVFGAIKVLEEGAKALKQVDDNVPDDYGNLAIKIGAIAGAVAAIGSLAFIASKIPTQQLLTGLGAVAAVSAEIVVASLALEIMNNSVSSDLNGLAGKLVAIIFAVGSMSMLTSVVGGFVNKNPQNAIVGLIAVGAVAAEIAVVSLALNVMNNNIKGSWGSLGKKLSMLGATIGAMLVITDITGLAVIATLPAAIVGLGSIVLLAGELAVVSKSIGVLNKNVPANTGTIEKKIKSLQKVIETITDMNLGGLVGSGKRLLKAGDLKEISQQVESLKDIAKASEKISNVKMNNSAVKKNIDSLIEITQTISTGFKGIHVKEGKGNADIVKSIDKILSSMSSIVEKVQGASGNINAAPVIANINVIKTITGEIFKTLGNLARDDTGKGLINVNKRLDNVDTTLFRMSTIVKRASSASGDINGDAVISNINVIKTVVGEIFKTLGNLARDDTGEGLININKRLDNLDTTLFRMGTIIKRATGASGNIDATPLLANINVINTIVGSVFKTLGNLARDDTGEGLININRRLDNFDTTLFRMSTIVERASKATGNINGEAILANMNVIRKITGAIFGTLGNMANDDTGKGIITVNKRLDNLDTTLFRITTIITRAIGAGGNIDAAPLLANINVIGTIFNKVKEMFGAMTEDNGKENININKRLDNLDTTLFRMQTIITRATGATGEINAPAILANINVIKTFYNEMLSLPKESLDGALTKLDKADTAVYRLGRILDKMRSASGNVPFDAVNANINGAVDIINRLNAFPAAQGLNSLYDLVSSFGRLLSTLSGLNGKFNVVGQDYGKQIVQGFKSVNVPNAFVAIINSAITQLQTKVVNFENIGRAYGQALKNAFNNSTQDMGSSIDATIGKMSAKNSSFANLGNLFGNSLTNSFGNSLMTLSSHVANTVQAMQLSFNSLKAPTIDMDVRQHVRRSNGVITANAGGSVNDLVRKQDVSYLSDGGSIFKPKGADIHPAMLASGEYVQQATATNYFGSKFMDRVNASDLKGTLQALSNRFSSSQLAISSGQTAVYNYHNVRDNHSRYNQTVITSNPDFAMKNPNRFLR